MDTTTTNNTVTAHQDDMYEIRDAQLGLAQELTELLQRAYIMEQQGLSRSNLMRTLQARIQNTLKCMHGLEQDYAKMANGTYRVSDPDAYERNHNIQ